MCFYLHASKHKHLVFWQDSKCLHQGGNQLVYCLRVKHEGEDVAKHPTECLLQFGNINPIGYCRPLSNRLVRVPEVQTKSHYSLHASHMSKRASTVNNLGHSLRGESPTLLKANLHHQSSIRRNSFQERMAFRHRGTCHRRGLRHSCTAPRWRCHQAVGRCSCIQTNHPLGTAPSTLCRCSRIDTSKAK